MSAIFAKNLKAYRTMNGMTQSDLANAAGLTRSAINNYESGKSEPKFDAMCKLANVLGVDVMQLRQSENIPTYIMKSLITDDEHALLAAFREADPVYQGVALDILRQHKRKAE